MKRALIITATCIGLSFASAFADDTQRSATRTEKDLLGEKEVPSDAYYGVQTARALENFQISDIKMDTYPEFVEAFAIVKLAAARAKRWLPRPVP